MEICCEAIQHIFWKMNGWNLQITHEKKGTLSEAKLQGIMLHVNLQECTLQVKNQTKNGKNMDDPCTRFPILPSKVSSTDRTSWIYDIYIYDYGLSDMDSLDHFLLAKISSCMKKEP